jgi:opacity protein-like surface antigen
VCASVSVRGGEALSHRISGGVEIDTVMADVDTGYGVYLAYEVDLPKPISLMLDCSYIGGDFNVASGAGSYTSLGIGAYLIFKHQIDQWTPYIGCGGVDHFNHFDNVKYDNKLSMVWLAGSQLNLGDRLSLDASLRYRTLRVNADDTTIKPNPLDMDSLVIRVGVMYEL